MTAPTAAERVAALRAEAWDAEYRPVVLYSWNLARLPLRDCGKRPVGDKWQEHARRNPPEAVGASVEAHAMNTGILCDGLRAVGIDIDDGAAVAELRSLAFDSLGEAPARYRANPSPRCLLVYRAVAGEPPKRQIVSKLGKVEVLGRGQAVCRLWTPSFRHGVALDAGKSGADTA